VGAAIAVPTLLELEFPLVQACAFTGIGMIVYTAVAFFFRPEANTDNLGFGGGMANDPFQYGDNVNRILWRAHCLLGPGRFTADTFLDVCVLVGLLKSDEPKPIQGFDARGFPVIARGGTFDATTPIAALAPNRFAQSSGTVVAGQILLDSQRFFQNQAAGSPAAPVKA
jgi:hypothetical protein